MYVGVVNFSYKRVNLLLKVWTELSIMYPEWSLKIVGGGPDLERAQSMSDRLNINNIFFEGFKNPEKYYKEASIFCMTSSAEGFGVVLVEAMQYGVVPVAFNSYASITDIIDNNENGILITPFDIKEYIKELSKLIDDFEFRNTLARGAVVKSKEFGVEVIGEEWLNLWC